jgi:serine protease Do
VRGWRGIVLAGLFAAAPVRADEAPPPRPEEPLWTDRAPTRKRIPTLAELADHARPAVVHVRGTLIEPPRGPQGRPAGGMISVGSGFFISRGGYVITNEHVVRGAVDIRVRMHDGRELPACVTGADQPTDVALLKVEAGGVVPVLPLADSDAVRVGDTAVAIGSPFGFSHSVTAGIVSAKDRVIDRADRDDSEQAGETAYSFFIQTDASINVGNSGGPLLDAYGGVIGINAAFWGGGQAAQGVSFAIPVNIAKLLLPRLRADGEAPRSFLGVESQPLTASLAEGLGLPSVRGALIAGVMPGSPAEAAGLEPGDVVLSWDGRVIVAAEDFKIYAQLTPPERRVKLRVLREGHAGDRVLTTRRVEETLPPAPHPSSCRGIAAATVALPDGFEAADLPPSRARGLPGNRGVEVVRVEGGGAREAGLIPRDIVLRVGRTTVRTAEELRKALRTARTTAPVLLLVRRQGADFWAALPRR